MESKGFKKQLGKKRAIFISTVVVISMLLVATGVILANKNTKQVVVDGPEKDLVVEDMQEEDIEQIPQKQLSQKEWIYYSVIGETSSIYRVSVNGGEETKVFEDTVGLRTWEVIEDKIVYTINPNWDEVDKYYDMETGVYNIPDNGFLNEVYIINQDGTGKQSLVKGDVYNIHDPNEPNSVHQYEVILAHDGWIYFQVSTELMESGGWLDGDTLCKIRTDGTELTKISDRGVSGDFAAIRDNWAYFNSSSYGEIYSDITRVNLETGQIEDIVQEGHIISMHGDTMYYHIPWDYVRTTNGNDLGEIHTINLKTLKKNIIFHAKWEPGIEYSLDGNMMYYRVEGEDGEEKITVSKMDITPEQMRDIKFSSYDRIDKDGYGYYVPFESDKGALYKKDLITGEETLLSSSASGDISNLRKHN